MQREIGRHYTFEVQKVAPDTVVLDAGHWGALPVARAECPPGLTAGAPLEVFVYGDGKGRPVATTRQPAAELGQVAWLEVEGVNELGAFLDWGLPRTLFLPFAEQLHSVTAGARVLVRVYLDNLGRLAASMRLDHWIADEARELAPGQKVSIIIADQTELGYKAVINHAVWGLLYSNELYRRVRKGQTLEAWVQRIRDDGKVDLTLNQPGFSREKMDGVAERILTTLRESGGFLPLNDKTAPREIYAVFGVSKKVFKQALGALYKKRAIALENNGIRLL
jgi:predicted RNA-binding protein (virulence factor B family)